jgi:hypothetical protein
MSMAENNRTGGLPTPTPPTPPPPPPPVISLCVSTSPQARAKRKISALEEEVQRLKQDKAIKQRYERSRPLKRVLTFLNVEKQPTTFPRDEHFVGWLSFTLP